MRQTAPRHGLLAGAHALWDRVRVGGRDPVVLDLGRGGAAQYPTKIGAERRRTPAVAVQADLNAPPPVRHDVADRISLAHVLEHLVDFPAARPVLDSPSQLSTRASIRYPSRGPRRGIILTELSTGIAVCTGEGAGQRE
jgi:hypothetical protein